MSIRIGLIVGEVSGENLGLDLIRSLRQIYPDLTFEGVLGPKLIAEGGRALFPMERLSVMGFFEPLARLPELFLMRHRLIKHFIVNRPDIFIGVDAPDFNLGLERILKSKGIKTVHCVSPSVWAWRQNRIHGIKKSIDLMLTLLPFEAEFYQRHKVPVCFTGHPLADQIPIKTQEEIKIETQNAKLRLGLLPETPVIALLPGSRDGEIKYLADVFLKTALQCLNNNPKLQFIIPLVSEAHKAKLIELQQTITPHLPIKIMVGQTRLAICAADVVLVTSGTATLEVMLHKKPMVVAYRMHPITYEVMRRLVKVPYIALPNLLAKDFLVPEYIQTKATPELLANELLNYLNPNFDQINLFNKYNDIHQIIKRDASRIAAEGVHALLTKSDSITLS